MPPQTGHERHLSGYGLRFEDELILDDDGISGDVVVVRVGNATKMDGARGANLSRKLDFLIGPDDSLTSEG